jgi:hypothetical protein
MMLNNKYATTWTYYGITMSMNVSQDSQLSLRKYNTCILFIPSENNRGRKYTTLADQ